MATPARLAEAALEIAADVERAVFEGRKRADRTLSLALRRRHDLAPPDHRFISRATFALFRWRGWIEPLGFNRLEARLLVATLLDAGNVSPPCRIWARAIGWEPDRLFALGDAPTWVARAEGLRRLMQGQPVTADPWRLFPAWLREHLPLPPGGGSAKTRFVAFLQTLQTPPPLWVRAQQADVGALWDELRAQGVKPWIPRSVPGAAKLGPEVDVYHLPAFQKGALEIQDLAAQAVGLACDPDPGERWWDCCAGAGGKALHLAALMQGKGLVVATDIHEAKLKEAVRRARRSPYRNLTTKPWDGRHVAGKPGSFDGVLVDAPCSAIGTWRRNPDARWLIDREAIPRLTDLQARILAAASAGVRPGGTLVYSVCTLTPAETQGVVRAFLEAHPTFRLDPFPHPLDGGATTDGTVLLWPQDADTDAMFIARMVRTAAGPTPSAAPRA
ncbi:MAG TPA: RsmB/NOP family class I SAM-dependent RNA methyltransferase [Isosphaeraceae bacterium]